MANGTRPLMPLYFKQGFRSHGRQFFKLFSKKLQTFLETTSVSAQGDFVDGAGSLLVERDVNAAVAVNVRRHRHLRIGRRHVRQLQLESGNILINDQSMLLVLIWLYD